MELLLQELSEARLAPSSTLFSSISHLLATLPIDTLPRLNSAILDSPLFAASRSSSASSSTHLSLRDAFRTSLELKLVALAATTSRSGSGGLDPRRFWPFSPPSPSRPFKEWLQALLAYLSSTDAGCEITRISMMVGWLEGLKAMGDDARAFDNARRGIEIETLVALDGEFLKLSGEISKGKGRGGDGELLGVRVD